MNRSAALVGLGLLLAALTLAALWVHPSGALTLGSAARANRFVAVVAASVGVWLAAVAVVSRGGPWQRAGGRGGTVWFVLAVGLGLRAALLTEPPFLSSDIYRYVWDGRVQRAGINPYLYVPADPSLRGLRDAAVYPHVNRAAYAHTIYPPAAELAFAAIARVAPDGQAVLAFRLAMVAAELVGLACLWRLLALAGLPGERLLIYAWNPLALWAFACDGHVDALAVGALGVALLARALGRDGLAGAALAAAFLVKFLPAAVAPALLAGARWPRMAVAGAATVVLGYAAYASAGRHVLGFLGGYGSEEGLSDGSGIWLLAGLAGLGVRPGLALPAYAVGVAAVLALVSWRALRARPGPGRARIVTLCRDAALLSGLVIAALSPHYPWYYAWLALPCVVAPVPWVVFLSAAPVLLYLDPLHGRFVWQALVFVPAMLLAVSGRARPRPGPAARAA